MSKMVDLGIRNMEKYDDEDYKVYYLSELKENENIKGSIYVSKLIDRRFFITITDHTHKQKWVCGITTSLYNDNNNDDDVMIYGSRGGRVYQLIDTLNHALNNTELNMVKSYSVVFETFKNTLNNGIDEVEVVTGVNSNSNVPNLHFKAVKEKVSESRVKADYKLK